MVPDVVQGDGAGPVLEGLVQLEDKCRNVSLKDGAEEGSSIFERNRPVLLTQEATARSTSAWVSAAVTSSTAKETR